MSAAVELWDAGQKRLIKEQIAPKATDDELRLFAQVCQRTGLDPFSRQIYAIHRNDRDSPTGKKMTIQVSIDGFRVVAERSREYEGQTPKQWCGPDGKWVDLWLKSESPVAARAGVWRKGFREPLYMVALWKDYAQESSPMWKKMGAHMLAKCAEAQALRAAFPADLSGLYTSDEMSQADNEVASSSPARVGAARRPSGSAGQGADLPQAQDQPALAAAPDNSNVDPATGVIDTASVPKEGVIAAGQRATEQRHRYDPPRRSQSAANTDAVMQQLGETPREVAMADKADAIALMRRIATLQGDERAAFDKAVTDGDLRVPLSPTKVTQTQYDALLALLPKENAA